MKKGFTTFLSALKANTPPREKRYSSLRFLSIFLILFLAVGNVWGQEITHTNPATITVANRVFLDLQGTPSNVTVGTDNYSNYGPGYFIQNKTTLSWWSFSGTFNSSSSSYSNAGNAVGFQSPGSSSASEFYQKLQMREGSDRMTQMDFYVKGTTSVGFQWKNGGTSNKYLTFTIYEMNVTGTTATDESTPVAIVTGNTASSSVQYAATEILDGSKYYHIQVTPKGTSNIDLYGLTFKHAQATANLTWNFDGGSCSGTAGTDYTAPGAVAIGGEIKYPDNATMSKDGYNFNGWYPDVIEMPATDLTITAQWVSASATESAITYADTKGADVTALPTTYYEGTGVASFEPIADVTDYHFVGWEPASISTEATGDQTITAQWVSAYNIEFNAGTGTGEVPATFQKWEGATFELPAQGALVAPTGKEFAGWSDGTNTYAAGDTYTMGAAAVTFTAQWKAAPTVLFHYQQSNLSGSLAADTYSALGGTLTTSASMNKESASYNSSVPSDLRGGTNVSKLGSNSNYIQITLATGNFVEGDTIYVCGYKPYKISTTADLSGDIVNSLTTGTAKGDYNIGYIVLPAGVEQNTIYLSRAEGTGTGFAAIKVIRPAQKEILSEDITLSAVAVNTEVISAENLAILKADPYKLDLTSEYAEAPTIAFTKQTVITYEDATTKTTTEAIEVEAAKVDGKWQALAEINGVTYTVTAIVPATYTVIYKDGETELASEIVKVGEHPTAEGVETKPLYALSWKLAEEVVELANVNGTPDQEIILTAVWAPKYAATIDFTTYVQEERLAKSLADVLKDGNHNYICGGTFSKSEWGATSEDAAYQGYKFKDNGVYIEFLLKSGKRATFLFGNYGSTGTIKVGTAEATECTPSDSKYVVNATSEDVLVRFTTGGTGTVTLKSITIGDIPATSDDATLKDLKVNGTTIAGFNSATKIYYLTVPYGTEVANMPKITEATANHASAAVEIYPTEAPEWKDEYGCYLQQVVVTAEDGITKGYYHVRTTVDAKQGVSLIKATHTDAATADVTGYIGGSVDKNTQGGGKLGSNGHYFGIKLAEGTFLEGDVVTIYASTVSTKVQIFSDKGETMINDGVFDGNYYTYTLTEATEWIYLYRTETAGSAMNPTLGYIEVQRYMDPFIESFVIGEAVGTIDQANKTIAIEVPASADVTALEPTIVAWANGSATVTPTGAQDFTNPVTYSVTSAYAEDGETEYIVTVTKALPSADATLATLTYNGTNITLEADQYNYEVELPKGTVDVPTVTYTTNNAGATVVKTDAAVLPGATTIIVTAEDGTTQQNYTINFTVSTSDIITIFDGSTMSNIATSPSGAISWEIVGSTMGAGDKNISYNDVTYTRALSCGNSSATKHLKIVVADNNKAQFEIIGMSNSSSDTRHAWLTNSTDKGEFANAIAGLTSNGYNPAKFTTDWLEEGTYYLHSDNTVAILLIRVKAEPVPAKCEAPTISGLADVAVCDLSSALLDGTATVSDGGTVTYKWYAEGDAETVLATTATYAPTTVGNYYVVATNSLADHRDNSTTSSVVVVRIKTAPVITTEVLDQHAEAGNNVTLSVVATDAESYQWYTCDDAAGTNPVEVVGATNASLEVAVTSGMSQYYKVIISNTCGSAESIGKVEEWTELPQAYVTESITWDWTVAAMDEVKTADGNVEYLMANVSSAVPNNENFRSDMLLITAQYANRSESQQFFQGTKIRFNTTIDGLVRVYYRSTGEDKNVEITINGISAGSGDAFQWSNYIEVSAGEVTIVGTGIGGNATGLTRIQKIEFLALGHRREASWIVPNELGTVCLKDECIIKGAELYELQGPDANRKLVFDEILSGELEAGKPYLFNATATGRISFYNKVNAAHTETAGSLNGMYGTFEDLTFSPATDQNIYYFSGHNIWAVKKNTADVLLPAYLCYVKMDELLASPTPDANPASGRRRVTLGVNGQQVATGVDQVQGDEVPTKMIINGQLFILRGEKMYDAQGKLVK